MKPKTQRINHPDDCPLCHSRICAEIDYDSAILILHCNTWHTNYKSGNRCTWQVRIAVDKENPGNFYFARRSRIEERRLIRQLMERDPVINARIDEQVAAMPPLTSAQIVELRRIFSSVQLTDELRAELADKNSLPPVQEAVDG